MGASLETPGRIRMQRTLQPEWQLVGHRIRRMILGVLPAGVLFFQPGTKKEKEMIILNFFWMVSKVLGTVD